MAKAEGIVVRHATREDVEVILQMIQELADYERESDAVKATPDTLLQTIAFAPSGSGSNEQPISASRPARALLLFTPEGTAAGLALYFYNYSTWRARPGIYLEDLFVRPAERRKGYGQLLIGELAKEVVSMNGGRLEWAVLKWNTPSIEFYKSLGARPLDEWMTMRVDGEALPNLARLAGDE